MQTTTEQTYESDLAQAFEMLGERVGYDAEQDEHEQYRKSMGDALNNTWSDGLPLAQWVDAAARTLGR